MNTKPTPPRQVVFDPTPEIFATDNGGGFVFPLAAGGSGLIQTTAYDEARFLVSIWHPGSGHVIDPDRAYVELQAAFDGSDDHWARLAEIEPVVPPYESGSTFDGWIVLPIFSVASRYQLVGGGFRARTRLQIRVSLYLVA